MPELHECVKLRRVRLKSLAASNDRFAMDEDPNRVPRRLAFNVDASAVQRTGDVLCVASLEVWVLPAEDDDDAQGPEQEAQGTGTPLPAPWVAVRMEHELLYFCSTSHRFNPGELKYFATHTVVFNAWPYWRHLLHQTFGLMELGFPLLPSYVPTINA